jgi:sec-independent protein translocase protein TatA
MFSPWHIAIFLVVVLVLFGPKRLPEMGRSLGKGMREFKDSITGHEAESAQSSLPAPEAPQSRGEHDTIG